MNTINITISIHPPREGWDRYIVELGRIRGISIHPPREGWDFCRLRHQPQAHISIHPPREGWDDQVHRPGLCGRNFNPPTP